MELPQQAPGTLIVIIGLPGTGKSTYITSILKEHPEFTAYDDYQGKAYNDDADPRLSKHWGAMISNLKQGETALVADIRFCVPQELNMFLSAVLSAAPNVKLDFRCFENNPELCKQNARTRNRKDRLEKELELIDTLSANYSVPTAQSMPLVTTKLP